MFTLPGDPLRYAEAWRAADPLQRLQPDELVPRAGCSIHLRSINSETYVGSTTGKACGSSLRGASYATSDVVVTPTQLLSWDRGSADDGEQVWGAETGPYIFVKDSE